MPWSALAAGAGRSVQPAAKTDDLQDAAKPDETAHGHPGQRQPSPHPRATTARPTSPPTRRRASGPPTAAAPMPRSLTSRHTAPLGSSPRGGASCHTDHRAGQGEEPGGEGKMHGRPRREGYGGRSRPEHRSPVAIGRTTSSSAPTTYADDQPQQRVADRRRVVQFRQPAGRRIHGMKDRLPDLEAALRTRAAGPKPVEVVAALPAVYGRRHDAAGSARFLGPGHRAILYVLDGPTHDSAAPPGPQGRGRLRNQAARTRPSA